MQNIKSFSKNTQGRDYVVGDIHGCFELLDYRLDEIGFDRSKDRLFSVGDLVDRGPSSERVTEYLAQDWFHAVRGNHEMMLLNFMSEENSALQYAYNGGLWFIELDVEQQKEIAKAIVGLPYAIEVETDDGLVGIVHAEVPEHDWRVLTSADRFNGRMREVLLWARTKITQLNGQRVSGIDKVYVGHTPVNMIEQLGNVHYIDTGAVFGNGLSIVRIQ
jgi:serine/threonine protein phosphatase 1